MTARVGPAATLAGVVGLACLLGGCDAGDAPPKHPAATVPAPGGDAAGAPPRPTAPAASTAVPASSCDLLSPTRVQEVLAVGPVRTRPADSGRTCEYVDPDQRRLLTVTVGDFPQAMVGGPIDAARTTATGTGPRESVPGVADAAVIYRDPVRGDGFAFARAHGEMVTSVDINAPAISRDRLIALGRTAAAAPGAPG
ncbi:DUF3558 family protein [Embleya sp. NBC_00896]|uniref:DUF3558 family protein n=1 Tax=Embleya sp. NBC_00896 TaxID=2975961 RepID=UPI00386E8182|nr:DUF3558 family protein [Embleya sp. NBC_00896]